MASTSKITKEFKPRLRNLVFEGGGVWGIAYEGALQELDAHGLLAGIQRVAGASAGAITAALLASGHTPETLGSLLRTTSFQDFMDDDFGVLRDGKRLLADYGVFKGDVFKKWIRKQMRDRIRVLSRAHGVTTLPPSQPTFRELAAWQRRLASGRSGPRLPALFIVGTNLSQQRRETYDARSSPTLKVEDAVRRSMSIPLFFAAARGEKRGKLRDVIVDGGLTYNYPINLFDKRRYLAKAAHGVRPGYAKRADQVINTETLGFRLDTTGELAANLKNWSNEPFVIDDIATYAWSLVAFIRAIANKAHLGKPDWARTVFIDVGEKIGFTDFDLTRRQMDGLSDAGAQGVRTYLEWAASAKGKKERERVLREVAAPRTPVRPRPARRPGPQPTPQPPPRSGGARSRTVIEREARA